MKTVNIRLTEKDYLTICQRAHSLGITPEQLLSNYIDKWQKAFLRETARTQKLEAAVRLERQQKDVLNWEVDNIQNGFKGPTNPDGSPLKFITLFEKRKRG